MRNEPIADCRLRSTDGELKNPKSEIRNPKSRGISLIAAIFIIVILAFVGVIFLTLFTSSRSSSINDLQSVQALYVAEGGAEYILRNSVFPDFTIGNTPLGSGNFSTVSQYTGPAGLAYATVTDNPLLAGAVTINVTSTANYIIPGAIRIESEFVYCTTTNPPNQFTGCTRGRAGSNASSHIMGSAITQSVITSTGTVGGAQRVVRESVERNGGNAIVNGGVTANLNGWTETITSAQGASAWSNYPTTGGTPGSLSVANTVGRNNHFQGYRQQTIYIPAGVNVNLQMRYCKNAVGNTGGGSTMTTSVVMVYEGGGTYTAWNDANQPANPNCSNAANWNAPVNVNFLAAAPIIGVRIVYDLTNRNGASGDGTQKQVWFDEISLTTPGATPSGVRPLSWQDMVN